MRRFPLRVVAQLCASTRAGGWSRVRPAAAQPRITHSCLAEDRRGRGAVHAAGRVERVNAEQLVDQAAGDAHHRRAAVVALSVELEGLDLRVGVALPRLATDVTRLLVDGLGLTPVRAAREDRDVDVRAVGDCARSGRGGEAS